MGVCPYCTGNDKPNNANVMDISNKKAIKSAIKAAAYIKEYLMKNNIVLNVSNIPWFTRYIGEIVGKPVLRKSLLCSFKTKLQSFLKLLLFLFFQKISNVEYNLFPAIRRFLSIIDSTFVIAVKNKALSEENLKK